MNKVISAGKNAPKFRKLLVTTAISAAAGMFALGASPAKAENWADHTYEAGSASVDTSMSNTTNITQHTYMLKARGDGNIAQGWTVNVDQPSSTAKYVLYDTKGTPSTIRGNLNANGQIYIFNKSGVIFTPTSTVNVGSIIASTGSIDDADIMNNDGRLTFRDMGTGSIELGGMMNVADAGLAAFVAPTVVNAGIINAKMGKVALAAGDKVTLDLYGDKLVEIAVDGKLADALIENSGAINAEGGHVSLTASAAKEAVDNVINMSGVVNVASATVKGGKIVLSGGDAGVVNVSGKMDASGTDGGSIDVKGQNINAAGTAQLSADSTDAGNGGDVVVFADNNLIFRGRATAMGGAYGGNGGFVELSARNEVGYDGSVSTYAANGLGGTFLLDPLFAVIHSGSLNTYPGGGNFLSAGSLALDLRNNANVIVQATNYIDVGSTTSGGGVGNGDVDVSTTFTTGSSLPPGSQGCANSAPGANPNCISLYTITAGNLTLRSNTVNLNKNLIMGMGNLTVDANTLKTKARIFGRSTVGGVTTLLGNSRLIGTGLLSTINVLSNAALIQQAISFADDSAALTTINIASGDYTENLLIDQANLKLDGAPFTVIKAATGGNLVTVTASNVDIDPIIFDGLGIAAYGINASGAGASGLVVNGNTFKNFTTAAINVAGGTTTANILNNTIFDAARGIVVSGTSGLTVDSNVIYDSTGNAVDVTGSANALIKGNAIGWTSISGSGFAGADNIGGDGIYVALSDGADILNNRITETAGNGIHVKDSSYVTVGDTSGTSITSSGSLRNRITNTNLSGILISGGTGNTVQKNVMNNTGNGIMIDGSTFANVFGNRVGFNTGSPNSAVSSSINGDGIVLLNSGDAEVMDNRVNGTTGAGNGIAVHGGVNVDVTANEINSTAAHGIYASGVTNLNITGNKVGLNGGNNNIGADGIHVINSASAEILGNQVEDATDDGIYLDPSDDSVIAGNTVTSVGGDGIDSYGNSRVRIGGAGADRNTITGASLNGIRVEGGTDNLVQNNAIATTGQNGIFVLNSDNVEVGGASSDLGNTITGAGMNGIFVSGGESALIQNNKITGGDGGFFVVGNSGAALDGIHVEGNRGIDILDNTIAAGQGFNWWIFNFNGGNGADGHGIFVSGSNGATIDRNLINPDLAGNGLGAGLDGIHVVDSNLVTVGGLLPLLNGNRIFSTGGDGIHIEGSKGAAVLNNMIVGTDIDILGVTLGGEIGGDGIDLNETVDAVVAGNIITDVDGDGIEVSDSFFAEIHDNNVTNADDDGIDVDSGFGISVKKNAVTGTEHNGIEVTDSSGIDVIENEVEDAGDDGIYVEGSRLVNIKENKVRGSGDDGIHVHHSKFVDVKSNKVFGAGDDGIDVEDSRFADVKSNFILFAGDNGIEIEDSDGADVKFNKVIRPGGHGVYVSDSDNVDVSFNRIKHAGNDGIHVEGGEDIDILFNRIKGSGNNGIDINYTDNVLIAWNRITDSEYDGINARWVYGSNRDGYALRVIGNSVDHSGDDGVDINWAGPVLVGWNWITDSGYGFDEGGEGEDYGNADRYGADGITVRNVNAGKYLSEGTDGEGNYYNYAVNIIGNHVHVTGDDGIEVVDSGATVISGNHVRDAGYGESHGEGEYYDGGDFYGADGIHVRNVHGSESYDQQAGFDVEGEFREYSVVIENNRVETTGDDGVQVLFSGDTRIAHNTITDSGQEDGARIFGGDGIHVLNFGSFGYFGFGGSHVEIVDNDVTNSLDDGVEVMGIGNFLIDDNTIAGSGDDGISVLSLNGFFSFPELPEGEEEFSPSVFFFPSYGTVISNNTVDDSGDNGLYFGGPLGGDVRVSGNTFNNNPTGALFESGNIDLTGDTNTINGGDVGLLFRPAIIGYGYPESEGEDFFRLSGDPIFAPMSLVDNTIGTTVFNGQSTYFVELDNGAFFAPGNPTILNGMDATYNGVNPSATGGRLTQAQFAMIEAGIFHYVDRQDLGLFFFGFVPNNINQKDIFRVINGFDAPNGGLNVTITGLPLIPGNLGAFFANIAPAAGEGEEGTDASDLANLEPAAGEGDEMTCWADAVNAALGGATVNFSFGGSAEDLLNSASGCQSGNI